MSSHGTDLEWNPLAAMVDAAPRRKIIYCCYGGTHSSPVAAAIHLGRLPRHRIPTWEELMAVPLFDRATYRHRGRLMLAGIDRFGQEVYVLGRGPAATAMETAVRSGWLLAGRTEAEELRFVNTLACVNVPMRVGGLLSRALGWVTVGRPLVLWGTQRAYPALCRLVTQVERSILGGQGGTPTEPSRTAVDGERETDRPLASGPVYHK